MRSRKLRQELMFGPRSASYRGVTSALILADLQDATKIALPDRTTMDSAEVYRLVLDADFDVAAPGAQAAIRDIYAINGPIDIGTGDKARVTIERVFADKQTLVDFNAATTGRTESVIKNLGLNPNLGVDDIEAAMLPDAPTRERQDPGYIDPTVDMSPSGARP